jgi:hypothetical protein
MGVILSKEEREKCQAREPQEEGEKRPSHRGPERSFHCGQAVLRRSTVPWQ